MKTRKEFLEAVMKMANLKDLKQADAAARAVIALTKAIIGEELSRKIAEVHLLIYVRGGNLSSEYRRMTHERDEYLFETGEVEEAEEARE